MRRGIIIKSCCLKQKNDMKKHWHILKEIIGKK